MDVNRGRFWSQDEYEGVNSEPASLHKYLYVGNNPVNAIDPSGYIGSNYFGGGGISVASNPTRQLRRSNVAVGNLEAAGEELTLATKIAYVGNIYLTLILAQLIHIGVAFVTREAEQCRAYNDGNPPLLTPKNINHINEQHGAGRLENGKLVPVNPQAASQFAFPFRNPTGITQLYNEALDQVTARKRLWVYDKGTDSCFLKIFRAKVGTVPHSSDPRHLPPQDTNYYVIWADKPTSNVTPGGLRSMFPVDQFDRRGKY